MAGGSQLTSSGQTGYAIPNAKLSVTDDGLNNLTIAVLTSDGSDPSPTKPLYMAFNDAYLTTLYTRIITYPLRVTIPAGATIGTFDNLANRIWVAAFDVSGTVYLAVCNCRAGGDIYPLGVDKLFGATASAISAASDSPGVFYATSAIAGVARLIANITYEVALVTAGNWSGGTPTRIEMMGPNSPRPGDIVQRRFASTGGAVATGTTLIPFDDTNPVLGEGDVYLVHSFAALSLANILRHRVDLNVAHSLAAQPCVVYLNAISTTFAVGWNTSPAANAPFPLRIDQLTTPATTIARDFNVVAGGTTGGTLTLNGTGGARKFGGFLASTYAIDEIWG
jgi:hypothetical protein